SPVWWVGYPCDARRSHAELARAGGFRAGSRRSPGSPVAVASWSPAPCRPRSPWRRRRARLERRGPRRASAAPRTRRRSYATPLGRCPNGLDDLVVAGASAEIAEHPFPDLGVGRVGDGVEQRLGRDDLARGADATLKTAGVDERLLDGMQPLVRGEALDRGDLVADGADRQRDARADHLAVEQHRARPADADAAAFLRAREPEIVPEAIEERTVRGNLHRARRSVDGETNLAVHERPSF